MAANTNFIVFGVTRSRLNPMIYRTQDEYTNQYTTGVSILLKRWIC